MGLFGEIPEPGSVAFRECPECGQDEIYSQSEGILSENKYICNHCGHEAKKSEVKKTFTELLSEAKEEREQELDQKGEEKSFITELAGQFDETKTSDISDPELRQQVKDRQDEGWAIEEITHSGSRVVMSTAKGGTIGGHALTGVLTGLWTLGMGNVAYDKLSKKKNKERIVLRTDNESDISSKETYSASPAELIRELKKLNEEGLITDDEFEIKKEEILDDM
jgi:predicted RNA-binding Zn-ribbon protein involved in translation (DUF1610 family)